MEWTIVIWHEGADADPLAALLNEGWRIDRADATHHTIAYVLYKRTPTEPPRFAVTGAAIQAGVPHFAPAGTGAPKES